jgi:hypothetical protein
VAAVLSGFSLARAEFLYGVSEFNYRLYTFDSATGETFNSIPFTGTQGGAERYRLGQPGRLLLTAYNGNATPIGSDTLFHLNPTTGVATPIGVITNGTDPDYWVEGLAWVNGTL